MANKRELQKTVTSNKILNNLETNLSGILCVLVNDSKVD